MRIDATEAARKGVWGGSVVKAEIQGRVGWVLCRLDKPRRRLDKKVCRYVLCDLWLSVTGNKPEDLYRVYGDEYHLLTSKDVASVVRGGVSLFDALEPC